MYSMDYAVACRTGKNIAIDFLLHIPNTGAPPIYLCLCTSYIRGVDVLLAVKCCPTLLLYMLCSAGRVDFHRQKVIQSTMATSTLLTLTY